MHFMVPKKKKGHGVAYQVIKDTLVQLPLGRTTLPKLLISVVQTLPVLAELGEAVGVDIRESAALSACCVLFPRATIQSACDEIAARIGTMNGPIEF